MDSLRSESKKAKLLLGVQDGVQGLVPGGGGVHGEEKRNGREGLSRLGFTTSDRDGEPSYG